MPDADPGPRFLTRRALLRGLGAGLVCAAGLEFANVLVGPNYHTVIPGVVYRTAQPSASRLERLIKTHGIRTLVNFRGVCDDAPWYREQCRITNQYGVSEEDLNGCSASRLPSVFTIRELLAIFERSAYPLLLHCNRGIDRTGLASTAILLLRTNLSVAEARKQLGYRYCHLDFGKTGNIDLFFDLYEEWLTRGNGPHSSATFRRWMAEEYCPGPCRADLQMLEAKPRLPAHTPKGLRVRCVNTSVRPWPLRPGTNAGIHLQFLIHNSDGACVCNERAGLFDAVVAPGEGIELVLAIPPLEPGAYVLRMDMVDEQRGAFHQFGSAPLFVALEVR